jgi:hypothetical protein
MQPVEFAVWAIMAVFTIFYLSNWALKKRRYRDAILFDKGERIALHAAPWVAIGWMLVLLLFLFLDLSKLYLLVVFPGVYIIVTYQVAKNTTRKD